MKWRPLSLAGGVLIIAVAAATLLAMGRNLWVQSGTIKLWTSDAWGPENSQQLFDPYSFTHLSHGILFYALLHLVAPRWSTSARVLIAVAIEAAWEVLENTDAVIDRYRAATLALGYYGDTVINSVGDILMCLAGFGLAARLPVRLAVCALIVLEIGLLLAIRDNLALNVLMLAYPVDAIKQWQLGH